MTSNTFKLILLGVTGVMSALLISATVYLMRTARATTNKSLGIIEGYSVDDLMYVKNDLGTFVTGARMKEIIYHYNGYMPYAYLTKNSEVVEDPVCDSTEEGHTHRQPFYDYSGCNLSSCDNYVSDSDTFYFIVDEDNELPFLLFVQDTLTEHYFVECDFATAKAKMNEVALQISNAKNITNEKFAYNTLLDALRVEAMAKLKQLTSEGMAHDVEYWTNNTTAFKTQFDVLLNNNDSFYNYRRW